MPQRKLTIGRESVSDIVVSSPYLSSVHAEISLMDAPTLSFSIKDLGSTNGTFINGVRVERGVFGFSDKVSLGAYQLEAIDFIGFFINLAETVSIGERGFSSRIAAFVPILCWFLFPLLVALSVWFPSAVISVLATVVLIIILIYLGIECRSSLRRKRAQEQYFTIKRNQLNGLIAKQKMVLERQLLLNQYVWQGFRKFKVVKKVQENKEITSFYIAPHDGKGIPDFHPGQFLTFRFSVPGNEKPVVRCYSLSCGPNKEYYRVSIKRIGSADRGLPKGLGSNHMHDSVHVGDIVDVKSPSGSFFLDIEKSKATVLLAGGVGITPMLSMLDVLAGAKVKHPVWLFYGVRNQAELTQVNSIRELVKANDNFKLCICFSQPGANDVLGRDFDHLGRVNQGLLKEKLGSNNYQFFLCGPGAFMEDLNTSLIGWGVPERDINLEAFGPSSVKKITPPLADAKPVTVQFKKSGRLVKANSQQSLLEIAEHEGLSMDFGCRAGSCGSCEVAIVEGEVSYDQEVDFRISEGCCLACVAKPKNQLIIDA